MMLIDSAVYKTPSIPSIMSGAIVGLVCISPATGFIDMAGAFFLGFFGGPLCFLVAQLKRYLNFGDALDVFGVHVTGGIIGGIAVAFFATDQVQPLGFGDRLLNGVYYSEVHTGGHQIAIQLVGILFTMGWSFIWTFCIVQIIDKSIGLKKINERLEEDESHWSGNETKKRNSAATLGVIFVDAILIYVSIVSSSTLFVYISYKPS